MTSDPDVERRLGRVENDTESIYELIGDFRGEFNDFRGEFGALQGQFNDFRGDTVGRFDTVDGSLIVTGERLDRIERALAEVVRRLPEPS